MAARVNKPMFSKRSMDDLGNTLSVTQSAESLTDALDQEVTYYFKNDKILTKIHISLKED